MASNPQSKGKYWLAGHTDSEITYDEVKELATILPDGSFIVKPIPAGLTNQVFGFIVLPPESVSELVILTLMVFVPVEVTEVVCVTVVM